MTIKNSVINIDIHYISSDISAKAPGPPLENIVFIFQSALHNCGR